MHYICVLFLISYMHYSTSFLLETSTNAATSISQNGTTAGQPTTLSTSSELTTNAPSVDAINGSARAMVMKEVDEGVTLKARFEKLKQNITDSLTSFKMELSKRYIASRNQLNDTKTSLDYTFESVAIAIENLKYNLSKLRETEFTKEVKLVKSIKEELHRLQHAEGMFAFIYFRVSHTIHC